MDTPPTVVKNGELESGVVTDATAGFEEPKLTDDTVVLPAGLIETLAAI
jgi:hypothetical protein